MNPTTTKYKMKKLYILLAVLSGLACVGLALSRLLVNYATVSTVSQAAGPEHAPAYTAPGCGLSGADCCGPGLQRKGKNAKHQQSGTKRQKRTCESFFSCFHLLTSVQNSKMGAKSARTAPGQCFQNF